MFGPTRCHHSRLRRAERLSLCVLALACVTSTAAATDLREGPLVVPEAPAARRPEPRFWPAVDESSGLALAATYGVEAGMGAGVVAAFQVALPVALHLSPRAGVGAVFVRELPTAGYAFGTTLEWGRNHRVLGDVGFGVVDATRGQTLNAGELGAVTTRHGVTFCGGYGYMAPFGLFARALLGASVDVDGEEPGKARFLYGLSLGLKVF